MTRAIMIVLMLALGACASAPPPSVARPPTKAEERAQAAELFAQGNALAAVGDLTRAEQYLATALRQGHDPERTMRALLSVCLRASRLRSALAYAAPHLQAHPGDITLRQLVASIELALGDARSAERDLRRVLAQDRDAADARFLLATILQQAQGSEAEAAEHFAHYVALRPDGSHAEEARASLALLSPSPESVE